MEAGRPHRAGGGRGAQANRGPARNGGAPRAGRTRGHARRGVGRRRVASRLMPAERGPRGAGGPGPTPERTCQGDTEGETLLLPLHPPETNSRGRRTPPTCSWGVRRPRGGMDADLSGHDGPGRRQAPRRPHDAGRPTRDVVGTWDLRRPARGGRPMLGAGGPWSTRRATTKGPGWAVDAARLGRDPHARVFEGVRIASGPVVHRVRGGAMAARDGLRARTAPLDAGRPLAAGMPRVFERRADCSGTVVHLGRGVGDPGLSVAQVSDVVCPRQRPLRISPASSSGPAPARRSARGGGVRPGGPFAWAASEVAFPGHDAYHVHDRNGAASGRQAKT
jgi:hypothetical protein